MKNGFVKVAACSPEVVVADTYFNAKKIVENINLAFQKNVKVLVFPELSVTGYTCGDLFYQEILLKSALKSLEKITRATKDKDMLVFVGVPVRVQDKIFNCAVALFDGQILGVIPKTNLPNYNEFYEKRQFSPAEDKTFFININGVDVPFGTNLIFESKNLPSLKVACEICEDIWVMDPPNIRHTFAGATIIVNLSASNELVGKADYRRTMISATTARLNAGYIYASSAEGESTSDTVFAGHKIISENGIILAESRLFDDELIVSEFDINNIIYERTKTENQPKHNPDYTIVEFDQSFVKTELTRTFPKYPFVPTGNELAERSELILNIQAHALAKRVVSAHAKNLVIGISGGLDSTLALLACVKAMEILGRSPKDVIGITMPCFGTTDRTKNNALDLMNLLGVTSKTVNIQKAVLQHFEDIGHPTDLYDVTYENCQARERTQVLMDIANQSGGLVVGTGDLSESALGWATYNGDHMSMYSVNCGVPKTLVSHIIRYKASVSDEKLKNVLLSIADTDISPELLPPDAQGNIAQKTEDKVGPYILHDFFLFYIVRKAMSPSKVFRIAKLTFKDLYSDEIIKKWLVTFIKRFFAQQFKRNCVPDGVKIGSVSLSPRSDWRMPSDAVCEVWLRDLEENDD